MKTIASCFLLLFAVLFSHTITTAQTTTSHYVPVQDSTLLALDVHLPADYAGERLPTLMVFTRYWRSSVGKKGKLNDPLGFLDKQFLENGYAIVMVDVRGTGASFGLRPGEYSPVEVMDASAILDWVVAQSWCDGNIGAYGASYTGTTAELLCATKHPAIKAVIPGWSDFDIYRSPVRPYGMLASGFIKKWGLYVRWLDRNRSLFLGESIRPVDDDVLKDALKEHKDNPKIYKLTKRSPYRNSKFSAYDYETCSPLHWKKEIEESKVPMLVLTSWMDAGTAEGTLLRLQNFSNPQNVVMMSTSHGGWSHASPFLIGDSLKWPAPMPAHQAKIQLDFFDHHLKGKDNGVADWKLIQYYNMGEEAFKFSDVWPIPETKNTPYYFHVARKLSKEKPKNRSRPDSYQVDFSTTTGKKNRWTTQMGGPVLHLDNRNEEDKKMLTYTSEPLLQDLQITGTPTVTINIASTHEDGALFVYLEDVDENGRSRYITEGGLRLIHRKVASDTTFNLHSFNAEDASPMEERKVEKVTFKLWPTSVLIEKGHSIRIAIAGADKHTFDRFPKKGKPVLTILRDCNFLSFIELPVVGGGS